MEAIEVQAACTGGGGLGGRDAHEVSNIRRAMRRAESRSVTRVAQAPRVGHGPAPRLPRFAARHMACSTGAMPLDTPARPATSPDVESDDPELDAEAEARELAARLARRIEVARSFVRIVSDAARAELVSAGLRRYARAQKVARAVTLAAARAAANAASRHGQEPSDR